MNAASGPEQRIASLRRRAGAIGGQREAALAKKSELITKIAQKQSFINNRDALNDALLRMKSKSDFGARQFFETLLTQFLRDIKPDAKDNIKLTPTSRGGRPSISFDTEIDGNVRSIFHSKGGSVKNIVSIGLRFIVLGRTSNRRFVVFDEADCWLRPEYIPRLIAVMNQLAAKAKIQVLYISHHEQQVFSGKARIIELSKQKDRLIAAITEDKSTPQGGIRYIRLIDFKLHTDTMVELCGGFNVLAGDVDIGKSSVAQAFECVSQNIGSEELIRFGRPSCTIEIGIEDGYAIRWTYLKVGKKRTRYDLLDPTGKSIQSSDSGTEVPEWLHRHLGMGMHNGVDINLHKQDQMTFLLDPSTSADQKAELLALGQGGDIFNRMLRLHNEEQQAAKRAINDAMRELDEVKPHLALLRQELPAAEMLDQAEQSRIKSQTLAAQMLLIKTTSTSMIDYSRRIECIDGIETCLDVKPPLLDPNEGRLSRLLCEIEQCSMKAICIESVESAVAISAPMMKDVRQLARLGRTIGTLSESVSALAVCESLTLTTVQTTSVDAIRSAGERIGSLERKLAELPSLIDSATREAETAHAELVKFLRATGQRCPTCHSQISEEHCHAE